MTCRCELNWYRKRRLYSVEERRTPKEVTALLKYPYLSLSLHIPPPLSHIFFSVWLSSPFALHASSIAAAHTPSGRLPVAIQSLFMRATNLVASMEMGCILSPRASCLANLTERGEDERVRRRRDRDEKTRERG